MVDATVEKQDWCPLLELPEKNFRLNNMNPEVLRERSSQALMRV